MMMKLLLPALATAFSLTAAVAQEAAGPAFVFDTGTPPWRGERIQLPPGFAPDLGWKGVEEIRFAPGMFEAGSDSFFSYVLVFSLEPGSDTSEAALKREVLTYYRGLSQAVMKGKQLAVDAAGFTLGLEKAARAESAPAGAKEVTAYSGKLTWIEPFATQKDQTLHLEVQVWQHGGRPVVLSCVSPVAPDGGALWKTLRDIRSKFRFAE